MYLIACSSLLCLILVAALYCRRNGHLHREACQRREIENNFRILQQKYFRAQKELIKAKKENHRLTELDRDRSRSLGQSAHELRNPISALDSVFNLLEIELSGKQSPSPAVYQSLFGLATEALALMQIQVQKIEDARSHQVARERAARTPIELNALLRQVIALNEILASQKAIELRLHDESHPRIWADQNSCREIVDRLIRTTLERSPVGSIICLKVQNPSLNEVAFSIETEDLELPALVTEFLQSRKQDNDGVRDLTKAAKLIQTLADACDQIEAQGGTLEATSASQLTLRFPHVRLLTRNPFIELPRIATEAALEAKTL